MQAVLLGAREVGFTVLSMSISLIAVFIPILLMGGIVGRYFREFAVTLSVAILVSLVVSLTTTPMMCARLLRHEAAASANRFYRLERARLRLDAALLRAHAALGAARPLLMMFIAARRPSASTSYLYIIVPKGFFPQQDTGVIVGGMQADQSISFQAMSQKMVEFMKIVKTDPAVAERRGLHRRRPAQRRFHVRRAQAAERTQAVRRRGHRPAAPKLSEVAGAQLFLRAAQDIRIGGRQSNATYQYTLHSDSLEELRTWGPKIREAFEKTARTRRRQLATSRTRPRDRRCNSTAPRWRASA